MELADVPDSKSGGSDSGTNAVKEFHMTIHESTFDLSIVNDNIALEFTANGRSNTEKNPAQWNYNDINASFERFARSASLSIGSLTGEKNL